MVSDNEEINLILKAQKGDTVALEAVISRYFWLVRSIVRKYFITNGNEDDLFQEGCLSILKAVREYDPEKNDNILFFMSLCIEAGVRDALRAATRNKHKLLSDAVSLTSFSENADGNVPSEYVYDPVHNYIEREGLDTFYENVGKICSELHVTVLRYFLEGYTYAEIASMTGINSKKVDNIMYTVKKKIKENKNIFM